MFKVTEYHGYCSTTQPGQRDPKGTSDPYIAIINVVINCFLVHVCVIIGSFGNVVTVFVLSRGRIKDTSSILLLSMAACDLFFLVNLLVSKLDCIMARFDPVIAQIYHPYIVAYVRRPGRMAAFISFSHIVIISCERLLAVFYPLQVSQWVTYNTVLIVLVCVYFAWIGSFLPYAVANYEIEWILSKNYTVMLPLLRETQWFIKNKLISNWISEIINFIIGSLSVIVGANCCAIAYKLRHVLQHRTAMTSKTLNGSRREVKASRMLLVVCVVFSLCNLPGFSIYFYLFSDSSAKPPSELYALLSNIEELMLAINAAANFFVYILLSEKFYKSVVGVIVCRKCIASSGFKTRSEMVTPGKRWTQCPQQFSSKDSKSDGSVI